jgi:hypothetical protein
MTFVLKRIGCWERWFYIISQTDLYWYHIDPRALLKTLRSILLQATLYGKFVLNFILYRVIDLLNMNYFI